MHGSSEAGCAPTQGTKHVTSLGEPVELAEISQENLLLEAQGNAHTAQEHSISQALPVQTWKTQSIALRPEKQGIAWAVSSAAAAGMG